MKLLKLESDVGKWSYCNGLQYYQYVVYLIDKSEVNKYVLMDENNKEIYKPSESDIIEKEI